MNIGSDVSRGYLKIKGAADALNFDFRGKVVLDIGSSTGGFTAFALERGAAKVIAVEKGTRQMMPGVAANPKVELHEKTDIFSIRTRDRSSSDTLKGARPSLWSSKDQSRVLVDPPNVILADVSFLSLTKVLMYARMELAHDAATEFLVMLKPQFEAEPSQLNRGVVKNEKMRREIIRKFEGWLKSNGFFVVAKHDNEMTGRNGNRERFYYLKLDKNFRK